MLISDIDTFLDKKPKLQRVFRAVNKGSLKLRAVAYDSFMEIIGRVLTMKGRLKYAEYNCYAITSHYLEEVSVEEFLADLDAYAKSEILTLKGLLTLPLSWLGIVVAAIYLSKTTSVPFSFYITNSTAMVKGFLLYGAYSVLLKKKSTQTASFNLNLM